MHPTAKYKMDNRKGKNRASKKSEASGNEKNAALNNGESAGSFSRKQSIPHRIPQGKDIAIIRSWMQCDADAL